MEKQRRSFNKMLLVFTAILSVGLFAACGTDSGGGGEEELIPNQEGLYVYGSNTIAANVNDLTAKMNAATLDAGQGAGVENMTDVYGKFMYIGANSTIEFTYVEQEEGTTYGAPGGGSVDSASVVGNVPVADEVIHGTLTADSDPIEVTEEGLYYTYVDARDRENMLFILMPVKPEIIGDATPGQWAEGTAITETHVSVDSAVYEINDVELNGAAGYRYRFNNGWHAYQGPEVVTLSSLGVEDYATAWADSTGNYDIGYFLDNIPNHLTGLFTVKLKFNASSGEWSETKVKTGDSFNDYSDTEIGWFGNAYLVDGSEPSGQWESVHMVKTPEQSDLLYNWNWTVELIEGRSFVLRDPDGTIWITYGGAAKTGSAFDNEDIVKEDGQDNYYVNTPGTYNVTFTIDSETEGRILTIEPAE
ncbi:hypothetical protein [Gracilimonas mengyeensis]|uniref:Uncharacterized protein n=1 Tax=Gracilimonas mengyeensis TaxID=1302730 RepID=A0A521FGW1_9BACT|nr:hypothetical protein [Gracilimonas mengyeensis]SMO95379.1 hypothetical protein SAMN06265219_1199 [Gracilimonas mengyeensis]